MAAGATLATAAAIATAAAAPASADCVPYHTDHLGPINVHRANNDGAADHCSLIDWGTYWEGVGNSTSQFGVINLKTGNNDYVVITVNDDLGLLLGSSAKNREGTVGEE
ncbi:hypothetical protein CAQU_02125 [Corynebacterium aquilae DSM 44791]|uniref:Secreted protein n=1 Tax=Corynebacterium aquilae DSM 44791 TaxID=1431546 RepID=A0A1L7CDZ4_9CORY|nr:hypothetical protein CAQU_02125 [Corynebacterium aquilae DSM 44791]